MRGFRSIGASIGLSAWAVIASVAMANAASALDPNTLDSVVIIEDDEEGFVLFGNRKPRHLKPGMHFKLPMVERIAVIRTTPLRDTAAIVDLHLSDGTDCTVIIGADYNIGDAHRAFEWRKARGLDMQQDRSIFPELRSDYTEPERVVGEEAKRLLNGPSPRLAACGALEGALATIDASLRDKVNKDGTQIRDLWISESCGWEIRDAMMARGETCRLSPTISKSFSASAPDTPHRIPPRQNLR